MCRARTNKCSSIGQGPKGSKYNERGYIQSPLHKMPCKRNAETGKCWGLGLTCVLCGHEASHLVHLLEAVALSQVQLGSGGEAPFLKHHHLREQLRSWQQGGTSVGLKIEPYAPAESLKADCHCLWLSVTHLKSSRRKWSQKLFKELVSRKTMG